MIDITKVNEYLKNIIEQPVLAVIKRKDRFVLALGEIIEATNSKGELKKMPRFYFDIYSPFRIMGEAGTERILGSNDSYEMIGQDEDGKELSLFDEKVRAWIKDKHPLVKSFNVSEIGDLKICFTNGDIMEVYCANSSEEDIWIWGFGDNLNMGGYMTVTGKNSYWE